MTSSSHIDSRPFWERPEMVERFAARDPDHRLVRLVDDYPNPRAVRVLDLGCAAGRNAILLARLGFDVVAIDSSRAMVDETRRRLAEVVGPEEAETRVRRGVMTDLGDFPDGSIDLIVALGIYHGASSRTEWDKALEESVRVLAPGGRILVANHTEEFDPEGKGLVPVSNEPHVFEGLASGRSFLVDAPTLDREMTRYGLRPLVPTRTVRRETDEGGRRVTANALYLKP